MKLDLLEVEKLQFNELRDSVDIDKYNSIHFEFITKYTFDTLALRESMHLSIKDVKKIIENDNNENEYSELDIKEVRNHFHTYRLIFQKITQRKKLDEDLIKDIHERLTKDITHGGGYRMLNVQIPGAIHQPPDYVKVYDRMKKMFYDLEYFSGTTIQKAAFVVGNIFKIHPFLAYNSTLALFVMNYILLYDGYIAISIDKKMVKDFLEAIDNFKVNKEMHYLEEMIHDVLLNDYETWNARLENI